MKMANKNMVNTTALYIKAQHLLLSAFGAINHVQALVDIKYLRCRISVKYGGCGTAAKYC